MLPRDVPGGRFFGYGRNYDYAETRERLLEEGLCLLDRARKEIACPEARVMCRETEGRSAAEVIADEGFSCASERGA